MAKPNSTNPQLRQMIRKIVREELRRMQENDEIGWSPPDRGFPLPGRAAEEPNPREGYADSERFGPSELPPEHPPWASFGPPQPDPNRKQPERAARPPRMPEWPGPTYTPDPESGFDAPPYIPRRRRD